MPAEESAPAESPSAPVSSAPAESPSAPVSSAPAASTTPVTPSTVVTKMPAGTYTVSISTTIEKAAQGAEKAKAIKVDKTYSFTVKDSQTTPTIVATDDAKTAAKGMTDAASIVKAAYKVVYDGSEYPAEIDPENTKMYIGSNVASFSKITFLVPINDNIKVAYAVTDGLFSVPLA